MADYRLDIDCDGIKLNSYLDMPKGNPEKCPLGIISIT